ncbi:hypothetical protein GCM10011505_02850 [Tistrella bauzanensis]|uniref:Uncharacterized protein n=1 Tax=Tistrella bauzanensis TaxID=657419 RepID=A0ABQ1I7N7_9PROT|nr:hypothetical protein GCM10011505_02850 [Tistrella bauzanensis]
MQGGDGRGTQCDRSPHAQSPTQGTITGGRTVQRRDQQRKQRRREHHAGSPAKQQIFPPDTGAANHEHRQGTDAGGKPGQQAAAEAQPDRINGREV